MVINGKEYGFKLTVGASVKISRLCPDGDLAKLGKVMEDAYGKQAEAIAKIICYLNEGFVQSEKFYGRTAESLTEDMLMAITPSEFASVSDAAFKAFLGDVNGEIEVETPKKEEAEG